MNHIKDQTMTGIILYHSKYGSTRSYSEKLSERLNWPVYEYRSFMKGDISKAECIILASDVMAEQIKISAWAKKRQSEFGSKRILFMPVGATPETKQDYYVNTVTKAFPFLKIDPETVFPMQGRKVFSEMNALHRFMMKKMIGMIKDPEIKIKLETEIHELNYDSLTKLLDYVNIS